MYVSMGTMVLLDLMGGVALLLWGLHMVHSGILRAFGPDLRLLLAKALDNRFKAFAAGLGLTALLQSSTATALITSSFTAEGLVSLVPALAIMLGANVSDTPDPARLVGSLLGGQQTEAELSAPDRMPALVSSIAQPSIIVEHAGGTMPHS